ncbi:hypothetical protein JSE7799_01079 [Jannaschia seosinensis]|uniref:Phasin domain-containing protein n=1 Tax=Jannaschia seosinensis TaxID=313367 RepID=A0A0M7B985_9RHOB|nr:hypothetical protein [Jannaschia seosinensis]CUH34997.1 hypothetical protein JSE7799_01079 [Jannaschia seosinensis]
MADTKTKTQDKPAAAAGMGLAAVPWTVGGGLAATWLESVTRMNGEWAGFIAGRLKSDAEAQHQIFACGSPLEAQMLSVRFMQRAVDDYLTEAARIAAVGMRVAQDAETRA